MFLVPRDTPGITVNEMDTVAIHGLSTCEVGFADVVLDDDAVLGDIDRGFRQVIATLNGERLNAAAVAHFGQPEERLLGHRPDEVFSGREAMIASHLREALRTGEEMQVDMPAGAHGERLLRMRIFPYPGGVGVTFRNVAGLRNAERAEQEQAAQAQARLAHGGIGVGRLGPRGTFEAVEPPLARMAGFAANRLDGVRFTDLLTLPSRPAASEAIEAVLTGQGPRAFDSVMLVNGGGELPVHVALAELRDGFAISGASVMVTRLAWEA